MFWEKVMVFTLQAVLTAFAAFALYTILGMAVLPAGSREDEQKLPCFTALVSPVVGIAVWIVFSIVAGLIFGYTKILLIFLALGMAIFIYFRRNRLFFPRKAAYWAFLAGVSVFAFVVAYGIAPRLENGLIYFGDAVYDHVKVALVDSIAKNGLPPLNPWLAENGSPVLVVYYYALHAFAAQPVMLFGLNPYIADAALVIAFTIFIALAAQGAIALKISGGRYAVLIVLLLLTIPSDLSIYFDNILPPSWKAAIFPDIFIGYWTSLGEFMWTSHHFFSAAIVVILIYFLSLLLSEKDGAKSFGLSLLIGFMACAAFMTSVYAGILALFFFAVAMIFLYAIDKHFRKDFNFHFVYIAFAVVLSLVLSAAYIAYLFRYQTGESPLAFGAIPSYGARFSVGILPTIKYLLSFYFIYLPDKVGIYYILGIIALFLPFRKNRFVLFAKIEIAVAFILISFIHSTFYSNDFGWSSIKPAVLFMYIFASELVVKIYDALHIKKKYFAYAFILLLIAVQTIPIFQNPAEFYNINREDPELRSIYTKAIPGWDIVREHTDKNDMVLSNPSAFARLCYVGAPSDELWTNPFFSLYAQRYTPLADKIFAKCYSEYFDQKKIDIMFERITEFFAGDPLQEDVDYVADQLKVKAILVTPADGLWTDEGQIRSRYPNVVETEDYKCFYWNK